MLLSISAKNFFENMTKITISYFYFDWDCLCCDCALVSKFSSAQVA